MRQCNYIGAWTKEKNMYVIRWNKNSTYLEEITNGCCQWGSLEYAKTFPTKEKAISYISSADGHLYWDRKQISVDKIHPSNLGPF